MNTKTLIVGLSALFFLGACCNSQSSKVKNQDAEKTEVTEAPTSSEDIVKQTITNKNGEVLNLKFDNSKDIVWVCFNGDTAELVSEKPASGIWYKNSNYELLGKGNDVQLKKDGNIIFEHQDDVVVSDIKNEKGDTLRISVNNTTGVVKAYLNGGEEIEMKEQNSESGVSYKNNDYELTQDEESYKLTKNKEVIFEN